MNRVFKDSLAGIAAGAAGTTALNATTYLDMAVRGRPASSAPEDTVEQLVTAAGTRLPGPDRKRRNRVAGLGPLLGIGAGAVSGAAISVLRARGLLRSSLGTSGGATLIALLAGNLPPR